MRQLREACGPVKIFQIQGSFAIGSFVFGVARDVGCSFQNAQQLERVQRTAPLPFSLSKYLRDHRPQVVGLPLTSVRV